MRRNQNNKKSEARRCIERGFCPCCRHRLDVHDMFSGCEVGRETDGPCTCPMTVAIDRQQPQIIKPLLDAARRAVKVREACACVCHNDADKREPAHGLGPCICGAYVRVVTR